MYREGLVVTSLAWFVKRQASAAKRCHPTVLGSHHGKKSEESFTQAHSLARNCCAKSCAKCRHPPFLQRIRLFNHDTALTVSHAFAVGVDCSTAIAHHPQKHGTRNSVRNAAPPKHAEFVFQGRMLFIQFLHPLCLLLDGDCEIEEFCFGWDGRVRSNHARSVAKNVGGGSSKTAGTHDLLVFRSGSFVAHG